jgi:hypothetical protein
MPLTGQSPRASEEVEKSGNNTRSGFFSRSLRAGTLPFWRLCFIGGGVAGVLVDLDHVPGYIFGVGRISLPFNIFRLGPGGFLHSAMFLVGCSVFACAGGLLLVMVLKDARDALKARRQEQAAELTIKEDT